MGTSASRNLQPQQLVMFKKLPPSDIYQADIEIPERAESRVPTDRKFLILLGVAILVLLPFSIYTLWYSDIDRYSYAYDDCGNVCGKENVKYDQWECSGRNNTRIKFIQIRDFVGVSPLGRRKCVSLCYPGYQEILGRYCFPEKGADTSSNWVNIKRNSIEMRILLQSTIWRPVVACFFSLGVALSIMYLFRVAAAAMVWSILAGVVIFWSILLVFLWYSYLLT